MINLKNKEFFYRLYSENQRMVRNVIYNMVGEGPLDDLVQEAFIKIWNGLSFFNLKSSVKTWIYRVSVNVAIDYFRMRKMKTEQLKDHPISVDNDNKRIVQAALMQLDDVHRTVVVLFYFEELKIQDIAKILNTAEGTVKSRLYFAKQMMKDFLEKQGVEL